MKPVTKIRTVFALVFVTASLIALWWWFAQMRAADSLAAAAKQRAVLEEEFKQARIALATANQKRVALPASITAATSPADVKTRKGLPPIVDRRADVLRKDPALQLLYLKAEHGKIRRQYGGLFTRLNLSPEQQEAFTRNLVRRREQGMDLNAIAQSQNPDRLAIGTMRKQSDDEYAQAQRTVIGESGFSELQTYERMAQPRETVASLAGMMATQNNPLSPEQGARLTALLASSVDLERTKGRIDLNYADWSAIDRGAELILNSSQLALFRTLSPMDGALPRWLFAYNAVIQSAVARETTEPVRKPPTK